MNCSQIESNAIAGHEERNVIAVNPTVDRASLRFRANIHCADAAARREACEEISPQEFQPAIDNQLDSRVLLSLSGKLLDLGVCSKSTSPSLVCQTKATLIEKFSTNFSLMAFGTTWQLNSERLEWHSLTERANQKQELSKQALRAHLSRQIRVYSEAVGQSPCQFLSSTCDPGVSRERPKTYIAQQPIAKGGNPR